MIVNGQNTSILISSQLPEFVRDNPQERIKRGIAALMYARMNWGWEDSIVNWKGFLREGISNSRRYN